MIKTKHFKAELKDQTIKVKITLWLSSDLLNSDASSHFTINPDIFLPEVHSNYSIINNVTRHRSLTLPKIRNNE